MKKWEQLEENLKQNWCVCSILMDVVYMYFSHIISHYWILTFWHGCVFYCVFWTLHKVQCCFLFASFGAFSLKVLKVASGRFKLNLPHQSLHQSNFTLMLGCMWGNYWARWPHPSLVIAEVCNFCHFWHLCQILWVFGYSNPVYWVEQWRPLQNNRRQGPYRPWKPWCPLTCISL